MGSCDRALLGDQGTIRRFEESGAPLTGTLEHDPVKLDLRGSGGVPIVPANAHIRLAGALPGGPVGERLRA
jgi:deferrochelatase/peroxidase EfeB